MNKTDIISRLEAELSSAENQSELESNRANAMDYYHGEPRGDEIEGRSQVVSTDVADVIEWILPQTLEPFVCGDDIVVFDPVGEEDEEQAEQETDYVQHVIHKENDWFLTVNQWHQDALLQKNGYVKVSWEDPTTEREEYEGLADMELLELVQDPANEVIESDITESGYSITILRTAKMGGVCIEAVPPEEIHINEDHNSLNLEDARFVAHETLQTPSDLIEQGYKRKLVESLPSFENENDDEEDQARDILDSDNPNTKKIRVYECYIRIDEDDDGISELRQIVYAGKKILSDEPCDRVPFAVLTPRILSHRHQGMSIYDRIRMIQDQKTAVWRNLLDNLYLQNNQRTYVNTNAGVNYSDLLNQKPGGVVRGDRPYSEAMAPIMVPPMGQAAYQMLEKLDQIRQERSGVGADTMGQNNSLSNDTAHGIERLMTAKEQLIGLITRTFAETGYRWLVQQVRELLMKHQDKPKIVALRGKYIEVSPTEWRTRSNTTIKIGLGVSDKRKKLQALQGVVMAQEKAAAAGGMGTLMLPKHLYAAQDDLAKAGGLPGVSAYFLDPDSEEAKMQQKPEQKPDPGLELLKLQAQAEIEKAKVGMAKLELEREKSGIELQRKQLELESQTILAKQATDAGDAKLAGDMALKDRELDIKERESLIREREVELKYQAPVDVELEQVESMQQLLTDMAIVMSQLSAPKKLVYDDNGRPIGVEIGGEFRAAQQDESGRIVGIE